MKSRNTPAQLQGDSLLISIHLTLLTSVTTTECEKCPPQMVQTSEMIRRMFDEHAGQWELLLPNLSFS